MLTYAHGINTIANLAPLVARGGIFVPLADPAFFAQVELDASGRFIRWPGDLDFCADALLEDASVHSRNWRVYLDDMLEACRLVQEFTAGKSRAEFEQDHLTYTATLSRIQAIGRSAERVPEGARTLLPDIEWQQLADLATALLERYYDVDKDAVWHTVENRVPELEHELETFLNAT